MQGKTGSLLRFEIATEIIINKVRPVLLGDTMADIEITTMSSKGQIVIPKDMRQGFKTGEKFVMIRSGKQLILKKTKDFDKNIEEDLEFARRTEEAWKEYDEGKFESVNADEFKKRLKSWFK